MEIMSLKSSHCLNIKETLLCLKKKRFRRQINHRIGYYMSLYVLYDLKIPFLGIADRIVVFVSNWFLLRVWRCKGGCLLIIIVYQNVYRTSRVLPVGDTTFPVTEL